MAEISPNAARRISSAVTAVERLQFSSVAKIGNNAQTNYGSYVVKTPSGGIPARSGTTLGNADCTIQVIDKTTNAVTDGETLNVLNLTDSAVAGSIYIKAVRTKTGDYVSEAGGTASPIAIPSIYPITTTTDSDLEYTRLPLRMQYTTVNGSHNPSAVTSSSVSEYYSNNPSDFSVSINGTAARFIILQPGTYRGIITFNQQFVREGVVNHQIPASISIKQVTDNTSNTVNVAEVTGLKNVWRFVQLEIEHRLVLTGLGNSMYRDGQFANVSVNKKLFPFTTATDGGEISESYEITMPFCFSVASESFSNNVFSPFELQLYLKRPGLLGNSLIRTFSNAFHSGTSWMVRSTELLEYLPTVIGNGRGGVQPITG